MQVRLAADFFRKERNQAYRNWRIALWRELIQNAVDANCSKIDITMTGKDDGFVLRFADNGPGMSREVLENVYFAVGATTKTDGNLVGGMGRARMLTCFAMNSYSIRSHDYTVHGSGGGYEVTDAPFVTGCLLDIDVDNYDVDLATSYLNSFLSTSNIRAAITINGERYVSSAAHRGRHVRDLVDANQTVFANVYVNKSTSDHRVIVRVNGVTMFTQYTNFEGQITVALISSLSRSVLTSNRDGLRGDYSDILNAFLSELSVNTKTALRGVRARRTKRVNNGGALRMARPLSQQKPQEVIAARQEAFSTSAPIVPETYETIDHTWEYEFDELLSDRAAVRVRGAEQWIADTFGDIYITDETDNAKIRKAISAYLPERWTARAKSDGGVTVKGSTMIKLLLCWKVCVSYAMEILCESTDDYSHRYSLGFLFNDEGTLATHRDTGETHVFSLTPVGRDGCLDYSIIKRGDLMKLMSLAKHEVTHMMHSWHNEGFATTREAIDFKFDQTECFRRIKDAIKSMPF